MSPLDPTADTQLILGCGYLGRRVAALWRAQGRRVTALTRTNAAALRAGGIESVTGDVCDPDTLRALPGASTVLYAVGMDYRAARPMHEVYVRGLANVLDTLPPCARFIYVSSTSVYGQSAGEWVKFALSVIGASGACALVVGWGLNVLGFVPFSVLGNVAFANNLFARMFGILGDVPTATWADRLTSLLGSKKLLVNLLGHRNVLSSSLTSRTSTGQSLSRDSSSTLQATCTSSHLTGSLSGSTKLLSRKLAGGSSPSQTLSLKSLTERRKLLIAKSLLIERLTKGSRSNTFSSYLTSSYTFSRYTLRRKRSSHLKLLSSHLLWGKASGSG